MLKFSKQSSIEIILLIAIALAVLIRIINLGSREFWYDEVLSLLLSTGQKSLYKNPDEFPFVLSQHSAALTLPVETGFSAFLTTIEKLLKGLVKEPHPPLFFLGQHFWLRLFGNSEAAMRSLVALFSIGAIGSAYGLGRRLLGYRGGLLFAAALGLNPYYLFHSLNVRMYGSLVFWVVLSTWALIELIYINNQTRSQQKWLWTLILIIAVTGGFMTFYYYAAWLVVMAALVLILDGRRWWQYGLCFATSILITVPWLLWGTRQQLRNADLERFATPSSPLEAAEKHLHDVLLTLGTHLVVGDWVSILPTAIPIIAGIVAIALLIAGSISLWQQNQPEILFISLIISIFPLLLMLAIDVVTGKFTLGFGWGRSVIFVLPGCLLLLVVWIERGLGKWRQTAAIALLVLYLGISVADFGFRQRWMFHEIADIIEQKPTQTTLIVMNSSAWGHVLRLVYYLPPNPSIMLLAQQSDKLAPSLKETLALEGDRYEQILWLDSAKPVWGEPSTAAEKAQIQQILSTQYQLERSQKLIGTWELDNFNLNFYQRKKVLGSRL